MAAPDRPAFIRNYRELLKPFERAPSGMDGAGARFGQHIGFGRIGINVEVIPPGNRSSHPHAESKEEEFVYVLDGTPDAWIDGALHPLEPGDSVALPAGTGVAHSFLNNSDADVRILIVGEHQVAGNQLYYPLNPERMDVFRRRNRAWDDAPRRELGPHDGNARAGTRMAAVDKASRPSFIAHFTDRMQPITDPSFANFGGRRSRLGVDGGLTRLGIHHDVVPPGNRTSHPHAESREEEFVFVLAGKPDVWMDGHLHELELGDGVGFPPGTGIAHSFLNNSDIEAHLLIVGEQNVPGNQLIYPLNRQRNEEFKKWGEFWEDAPERELGPHDGMAKAGTRKG